MANTSMVSSSSGVSDDLEEYEDDFEDYVSDFESDTSSIDSSPESPAPSRRPAVETGQSISDKFTLPVCVQEKLEPFLDEQYEVDSLERTIETGLKNFQTAGKRKREQEAEHKIRTRGAVLMEMIKLDTVSYTLLDLPAIPYEQYIKVYGRSNMTQIQTQTHDDNADKEVQTNEIATTEKWTQRPIILPNELNCSTGEYQKAKLGVGGDGAGGRIGRPTPVPVAPDPDRICAVGRSLLSWLERRRRHRRRSADRVAAEPLRLDFADGGHGSPGVPAATFLAGRPATAAVFARSPSPTEYLVTVHEAIDLKHQFIVCVWSVSNMENPEYVLKCPNRVTSFCAIIKEANGFFVTGQTDGSICVWDLSENRLYHQSINHLSCLLRSPSFNTALSADQGHNSKIVGLSTVIYSNNGATDGQQLDEVCSLDEDFVLAVWTVVDSWMDGSMITERTCAGTAPWSSVRLVKTQSFQVSKNIPRYISDGVIATCMCLNDYQDVFVGTNSGLVFRCNLGEHKVWPPYYTNGDTGELFAVGWLDMCPFDSNCFLAACSNGEVMVYRTSRREALGRFFVTPNPSATSASVVKAQWCSGFPGIVIGLDSSSSVHVWDLCGDDASSPIVSTLIRGKTVTSMALSSMRENRNTYLGLMFADGSVETHRIDLDGRRISGVADHSDLLARYLAGL